MDEKVSLNKITKKATDDFFNLLKKTWKETQRVDKKYSREDARTGFFSSFSETNLWLLIHLDVFNEMLNQQDQKISKYMNLNPHSRIQYLVQHDTINRISYTTKTMFDVEHFIKDLMKGLEKPAQGKYFQFSEKLLKILEINSEQKHKILNAPYQARNSLHNDGYSYHDFEISLRGKSYNFVKGQQITFFGWDTLHIFFDELIDVLIEITNNPKIEDISLIPSTHIPESEF